MIDPDRVRSLPAVVVVGFEEPFAAALCRLLQNAQNVIAVQTSDPKDLELVLRRRRPGAVVATDEALGPVTLARLAHFYREAGFVVVSRRLTTARIAALEECGAAAMLLRRTDPWILVSLIAAVAHGARGGVYLNGATPQSDGVVLRRLSRRELVLAELLREPDPMCEIASALHVELATLKSRAQSVYRKIAVSDRHELRRLLAPGDASNYQERRE